jgi:hypothetical protein
MDLVFLVCVLRGPDDLNLQVGNSVPRDGGRVLQLRQKRYFRTSWHFAEAILLHHL